MDDLLPSYDSVVQQNPWELIAPYLSSEDLCSAALVCQKWHEIFTPRLWGNPASHFGVENDTVYVALTRFKRTLFWSRLSVRELTHTLHLPPAHAEIYGGPHSEWLRDCLERLPQLQSLIVNGLPFFDHSSLLTLRHLSSWRNSTHPNTFPTFGLRLLDASRCSNATSTGLSEALPHFPDLVSLDLSRTFAAKDETVFNNFKALPNLRVLKLAALSLKDSDLSIIASAIRTRVRSLDVSDNHLTDNSARLLLDHCVKQAILPSHPNHVSQPPVGNGRPLGETDVLEADDLDGHLRRKLTQGFLGRLAIEDARDVGLTHLYLSRNSMTVEGISGLLRSKRLRVLDVGTLSRVLKAPAQLSHEEQDSMVLPGVEKLTPVLAESASEKLRYLRINFAIVTEDAPIDSQHSPRVEAEGDAPILMPNAHELEAIEPPMPELDSGDTAVYELPGDFVRAELFDDSVFTKAKPTPDNNAVSTKPTNRPRAPTIEVTSESPEVKRGPAYAPEPVLGNPLLSPISPLTATGGLSPTSSTVSDDVESVTAASEEEAPNQRSRHNSSHFIEDRRARLDLRQLQENRLHPGMLPKVHTLVLTDVPAKTQNQEVIHRLTQFIKDCAEETAIARQRATYTYILPPGRSRNIAEREYAKSLFALSRIVLEMAPPEAAPKKVSTSWRQYPTKSATEDADSEAFWEAANHDFSFFGDEECGLPNAEPGRHLPLAAMSGLQLAPPRPAPPPRPLQPTPVAMPVLDVVSEIGRFRKDRKAAYQATQQLGDAEPDVEGYWPGEITVVWKPADSETGDLDYYGNRYESGWLYR